MKFVVLVLSSVRKNKQCSFGCDLCVKVWSCSFHREEVEKVEVGREKIVSCYLEADVKLAWFSPRLCFNFGLKLSLLSTAILGTRCEMDLE